MHPTEAIQLFRSLAYEPSVAAIKEAARKKADELNAKIKERQDRIAKLREEHKIDDAALIQLYKAARQNDRSRQSYSYTTASNSPTGQATTEERVIGAGVVMNLLTESDYIEAEKESVKRLQLITRNLQPLVRHASGDGTTFTVEHFALSYDELEYLGL